MAGSPYTITYAYAGDANLAAVTDTTQTVTVTQATPAFSGLTSATISYGTATTTLSGTISLVPDGESVSITLDGVTQTATVAGGAFSSSFNTSTLGVAGSPYTITYAYAGDANLTGVTDTTHTVTVTQQTKPAFSKLSHPTIVYGTPTTTLSGKISLVPDGETVAITLDGVTQSATVASGAFSSTFNTSTLDVAGSPYTITYAYAGDASSPGVEQRNPQVDRDQGQARIQQAERPDDHLRHGHDHPFGEDFAGAGRRDGYDHA